MNNLKDKVVLITGATGILGSYYCDNLVKEGARLFLSDIESRNPLEFAKHLSEKYDSEVHGFVTDLCSEKDIERLIADVEKHTDRLDALVNNAAATGEYLLQFGNVFESFEEYPLSLWEKVIAINLTAPFLLIQKSMKLLKKSEAHSIVNVASIYGEVAPDHRIYEDEEFSSFISYSASKAGIHGITLWLSSYLNQYNGRINTIYPGGVNSIQSDKFKEKYCNRVPLGRMAEPADLYPMLRLLISEDSKYMTGQKFFVDGGLTSW